LKVFTADLHIHTCLSPCAELEMSPRRIVMEALSKKIDIIAVTDHNCGLNAVGVREAAKGTQLTVICGMEITTLEEVHILGYFPSLRKLMAFHDLVSSGLPESAGEKRGAWQVIANGKDQVLGFFGKNLFSSAPLTIEKVVAEIHGHGGLAAAAHIDREGFGLIGQLGFVPEGLPLDAAEYYDRSSPLRASIPFTAIASSDAHEPGHIGRRTTRLSMEKPTFAEFRMALRGEKGRRAEA